jgi:hypothetical protein
MDAVMRKTKSTRRVCSWVIVTAVTIQGLTPDFLDLTLLFHTRPPAPILAILILFTEAKGGKPFGSGPTRHQHSTSLAQATDQEETPDDFPDDACQPFWPELGLRRSSNKGPAFVLRSEPRGLTVVTATSLGRRLGRYQRSVPPVPDLPSTLCRLTC